MTDLGMPTQGRTSRSYSDYFAGDSQPRIWATIDITDGEPGVPRYHSMPPCGHRGVLSIDHDVEEEEDGTFTVQPNPPMNPDNSNSILCHCGWHGFIDHNVWRTT